MRFNNKSFVSTSNMTFLDDKNLTYKAKAYLSLMYCSYEFSKEFPNWIDNPDSNQIDMVAFQDAEKELIHYGYMYVRKTNQNGDIFTDVFYATYPKYKGEE